MAIDADTAANLLLEKYEKQNLPAPITRLTDTIRREAGISQKKDGIITELFEEIFDRLAKLEKRDV